MLVLFKGTEQQPVMREVHNESGRRGRVDTQKKFLQRVLLPMLSIQVEDYVQSSEQCLLGATICNPN